MSFAVNDLSVDYRGHGADLHAVRGVSFAIPPGRMLGLVGESGSGKSTVAFALMGLLQANARVMSGVARIGAKTYDLTKNATAPLRGRGLAMIFQDPLLSLNPVFTIGAHLNEVLRVVAPGEDAASRRAMAEEALAKVALSDPRRRLEQYPHELSGGMRQRVVIAMALLAKPELLIADEPTTALDVTVEASVMREICALRDELQCSVLLITHSLGLVTKYCDDMAVLYAGEMLEQGPARAIQRRPGHPYSRLLLDCEVAIDQPRQEPAAANRFKVIGGELPDLRAPISSCVFAARCDRAISACAATVPSAVQLDPEGRHSARCLRLGAA